MSERRSYAPRLGARVARVVIGDNPAIAEWVLQFELPLSRITRSTHKTKLSIAGAYAR